MLAQPLRERRLRRNRYVIERKPSSWGVKRPEDRTDAQPTTRGATVVIILAA
jgi:hypothetical protein